MSMTRPYRKQGSELPLRVSIAMCTYQGGRHVWQQLTSIAGQTYQPYELVVCDDGSRDDTIDQVAEFAKLASFPVKLAVNRVNMGARANFMNAIGRCAGDLIALADQDDVWLADKLERTVSVLEANPEVGLVFTDAELVDESLVSLGRTLWSTVGLGQRERRMLVSRRAFALLARQNLVTGATIVLRASYARRIPSVPETGPWLHDWWIALLVSAMGQISFVDSPTMLYRQHAAQHLGAGPQRQDASRMKGHFMGLEESMQLYEAVLPLSQGSERARDAVAFLSQHAAHLRCRARSRPFMERLPVVLGELSSGRYHRYSNGFRSAFRDLLPDSMS